MYASDIMQKEKHLLDFDAVKNVLQSYDAPAHVIDFEILKDSLMGSASGIYCAVQGNIKFYYTGKISNKIFT